MLARAVAPGGLVLAIDRDQSALEEVGRRMQAATAVGETWPEVVHTVHADFRDLDTAAVSAGFVGVDAILFDLGVSSMQLDRPERGFSLRGEGRLDMRMDLRQPVTAADLVNQLEVRELAALIRELGEERWAMPIARRVAAARPLSTTTELARVVEAAVPRAAWPPATHPATRTFQALRMAVNDELGALRAGLAAAVRLLRPGGRLGVIAFHSGEDRVVKETFRRLAATCVCPPQQPVCTCGTVPSLRLVTRHVVKPSAAEAAANPRARSARLRVAEKLATR